MFKKIITNTNSPTEHKIFCHIFLQSYFMERLEVPFNHSLLSSLSALLSLALITTIMKGAYHHKPLLITLSRHVSVGNI